MVLYAKDTVEKDFLSLPEDSRVLEAARQMKDSKHGFAVSAGDGVLGRGEA